MGPGPRPRCVGPLGGVGGLGPFRHGPAWAWGAHGPTRAQGLGAASKCKIFEVQTNTFMLLALSRLKLNGTLGVSSRHLGRGTPPLYEHPTGRTTHSTPTTIDRQDVQPNTSRLLALKRLELNGSWDFISGRLGREIPLIRRCAISCAAASFGPP